ncbi:MAG TPA: cofactor assembly of complex C subunit B, partial [Prochlorococcaceae cyanobacterium AMR_MDS_5431]|nr:cofactor assembly of complex C subunit B [Prochlorococcaceae cyanobacterium AMR_MDS_5431]
MFSTISSTFLLTLLLAIGLIFFLRAASKDRTTVVTVRSSRPAIEVLDGLVKWLNQRGWEQEDGDLEKKILRFRGSVVASTGLAILLSILGTIGAGCLSLIMVQLFPSIGWWPLLSVLLGPIA